MTTKDVLALALEALLDCARKAEALKKECGMNPESPQAIRNSQYMAISHTAHAAITAIKQAITPETGNAATPEASAITAGNGQQAQEPHFVGCAYYESNGACCESGEPCKADVQNNAATQPPAQQAQEPVEPFAWFAFADSNGLVPLELFGWDEKACKHAVLTNARSVGWKGTLDGYLYQQGWTIKPVYAHPAPKQAEPVDAARAKEQT